MGNLCEEGTQIIAGKGICCAIVLARDVQGCEFEIEICAHKEESPELVVQKGFPRPAPRNHLHPRCIVAVGTDCEPRL